jgi:protein-S-isoprenylcysteine O-methyltransferase Ste14
MKLAGKPTINPWLFYTGKISGYITWVVFVFSLSNDGPGKFTKLSCNEIIAYFIIALGLIFTIVSLVNLGRSTRLGLPAENTALKTGGIYSISRNPMYVGFGLLTIGSVIYTLNLPVAAPGIYSLVVYHLIIKGEEKFLHDRFGDDYNSYRKRVRRYL